MNHCESTTFAQFLSTVPDPRKKRGIRHTWSTILLLTGMGLLSGFHTLEGIGDWVEYQAERLEEILDVDRLPRRSTLRRAMESVDIVALEKRMSQVGEALLQAIPGEMQALALDGKAVRGAQTHGQKTHLLSLMSHKQGVVLAQAAVGEKTNEIPVAQQMLGQRDLTDQVVTADAMHTQRKTIAIIVRQQGHYLLTIKCNQPELLTMLEELFAEPAWSDEHEETGVTTNRAHGRDEQRTLTARVLMEPLPGWQSVVQILRRVTWRCSHRTGKSEEETTYAITDLPRSSASAAQLETYWRGHWGIENRDHHVRDRTWGEDASQCATGATAQAMAALRNGLLSLLRCLPIGTTIASTLRFFAAFPLHAFSVLSSDLSRL